MFRFGKFALTFGLCYFPAIVAAQESAESLLVRAAEFYENAASEPTATQCVRELLSRITESHGDTDIAVSIVLGEDVGGIDISEIEARAGQIGVEIEATGDLDADPSDLSETNATLLFASRYQAAFVDLCVELSPGMIEGVAAAMLETIAEFGLQPVAETVLAEGFDAIHGIVRIQNLTEANVATIVNPAFEWMAVQALDLYAEKTDAEVDSRRIVELASPTAQLIIAAATGSGPAAPALLAGTTAFFEARSAALSSYAEDQEYAVVARNLIAADAYRRAAAELRDDGRAEHAAEIEALADSVINASAEAAEEAFAGVDGPVAAQMLRDMDEVVQLYRSANEELALARLRGIQTFADDAAPGMFSLTFNNFYERYFMLGDQHQADSVRAYFTLHETLLEIFEKAPIEASNDADTVAPGDEAGAHPDATGKVVADVTSKEDFLYVQTHSRKNFEEAFQVAQQLSRLGAPHVNVFASSNGWFAITAVRVSADEATDSRLQDIIENYDLPKDSIFTRGERYSELRASFEDHSTRPILLQDSKPATSAAGKTAPQVAQSSVNGCDHLLPYPTSGPAHESTISIYSEPRVRETMAIVGVQGSSLGQKFTIPSGGLKTINADRHGVFRIERANGDCVGLFRGLARLPGDRVSIKISRHLRTSEILATYEKSYLSGKQPIASARDSSTNEVERNLALFEDVQLMYPLPISEGGIRMVEPTSREFRVQTVNRESIEKVLNDLIGEYEDIDLVFKGISRFSGGFSEFSRRTIASLGDKKTFTTTFGGDASRGNIYVRGDTPERAFIHLEKYVPDRATTILGRIEDIRILSVEEVAGGDCEWVATYRSWLTDPTPFGVSVAEQTGKDGFTSRVCFRTTRGGIKILRKEFLDN